MPPKQKPPIKSLYFGILFTEDAPFALFFPWNSLYVRSAHLNLHLLRHIVEYDASGEVGFGVSSSELWGRQLGPARGARDSAFLQYAGDRVEFRFLVCLQLRVCQDLEAQ